MNSRTRLLFRVNSWISAGSVTLQVQLISRLQTETSATLIADKLVLACVFRHVIIVLSLPLENLIAVPARETHPLVLLHVFAVVSSIHEPL